MHQFSAFGYVMSEPTYLTGSEGQPRVRLQVKTTDGNKKPCFFLDVYVETPFGVNTIRRFVRKGKILAVSGNLEFKKLSDKGIPCFNLNNAIVNFVPSENRQDAKPEPKQAKPEIDPQDAVMTVGRDYFEDFGIEDVRVVMEARERRENEARAKREVPKPPDNCWDADVDEPF